MTTSIGGIANRSSVLTKVVACSSRSEPRVGSVTVRTSGAGPRSSPSPPGPPRRRRPGPRPGTRAARGTASPAARTARGRGRFLEHQLVVLSGADRRGGGDQAVRAGPARSEVEDQHRAEVRLGRRGERAETGVLGEQFVAGVQHGRVAFAGQQRLQPLGRRAERDQLVAGDARGRRGSRTSRRRSRRWARPRRTSRRAAPRPAACCTAPGPSRGRSRRAPATSTGRGARARCPGWSDRRPASRRAARRTAPGRTPPAPRRPRRAAARYAGRRAAAPRG